MGFNKRSELGVSRPQSKLALYIRILYILYSPYGTSFIASVILFSVFVSDVATPVAD